VARGCRLIALGFLPMAFSYLQQANRQLATSNRQRATGNRRQSTSHWLVAGGPWLSANCPWLLACCGAATVALRGNLHSLQVCHSGSNWVPVQSALSLRTLRSLRFSALGRIHWPPSAPRCCAATVALRGNLHSLQVCHSGSNWVPVQSALSLRTLRSLRFSALGRIRTCDFRFRRPTLYPAELRAQRGQ
jgi:hypothetical protein